MMGTTPEDTSPLPDPARVEALAGFGLSAADIAMVFDIDAEHLRKHFARELAGGQIKANARVAESLYRKATGEGREAVTAAIFWLKTRAHWKETSAHEHSGALVHDVKLDGEPVRLRLERMIDRLRLSQELSQSAGDGK